MLLVKTADGIEDIIDVSTENLARLKEEAQMAENDVIMRYIRVLSELSGQIRYAAQKRIMVEIGLIKLCRPSMETDTQSLADRIRQIEDKLESGSFTVVSAPASINDVKAEVKTAVKMELPTAVPEDVEQAVSRWSMLVSQAAMPMKAYLKSAYPSLAGDGSMLIVVEDGLPADYFREQSHKEELENLISESVGKEIRVTVQSSQQGRNPRDTFPDLTQVVSQAINMEIEIEEMED